MTTALVLQGLAPLLLAAAIVWAAGLMAGDRRSLALAALLSLALGHGLAGLDSVIVRLLVPALIGREWLLEALLAALIALAAARRPRPSWARPAPPAGTPWRRAWSVALLAALGVAVWASFAGVLVILRTHPHSQLSDAYVLWNLKARFLYRGGGEWTRLFDPHLRHTGYPLLHPALVARLWGAIGADSPAVPQALVVSYLVLAVGMVIATLHAVRGWITAALGGLALLSLPFFVDNAEHQCADLPLSVFALAALSCLVLGRREHPALQPRGLLLAGVFASLAAWTKNEGLLLVGALMAATVAIGGGGIRARWRRGLLLLAGAAPALGVLAYTNATLTRLPSPYVHQSGYLMVGRAITWERHAEILAASAQFAFAKRQRLALGLLAVAAATSGLRAAGEGRFARRLVFLVVGLMGAAFYAAYLITPYTLKWQLASSLDRLFVQYWPALVLGAFVGGLDPFDAAPEAA